MLTRSQEKALEEFLSWQIKHAESDLHTDSIGFIGYRLEDFKRVLEIAERSDYFVIECELFRHKRCSTEEFCALLGYLRHNRFLLILPRVIPFSVSVFLYNLYDHGIVSAETSFSSDSTYPSASGKAWVAMMNVDDFDDVKLEPGNCSPGVSVAP